ncbi:MAG: Smr/MutS family protein [Polyangiaceae bacterium]
MEPSQICPQKTRLDLEWDRLLSALADRAESELGKQAALALPFGEDRASALLALAEVREAVDLDNDADPLRTGSFPDAAEALAAARIGSPLGIEDLRGVHGVLTAAQSLRGFLRSRSSRAPKLFAACVVDPLATAHAAAAWEDASGTAARRGSRRAEKPLDPEEATARAEADLEALERSLDASFEPDGSISDRASPELGSLRAERRAARDRLVRKLEELVARHSDLLQDAYFTERDGRYVLPVRADAHERLPGIVHSASASGATVFVEPSSVAPHGNRLKMLDAQIDRAERAVLAALSAKVSERADLIGASLEALAHADLRGASARLARDLRLTFPEIAPAGEPFAIELRNARHPLLVLDGVDVVASDLSAREGEVIVVSGPNAGGKTIALKTLGLAALMLRAGLPVPARDGSRLALVEAVLTDVGDDQNLHKNLSTFSAHVQNLAAILHETKPFALVLLDEICGGTDPREGEALAAAILDSLAARGGSVVCTTHYEGLKSLALDDRRIAEGAANHDAENVEAQARAATATSESAATSAPQSRTDRLRKTAFRNASVGFDMATMSPTFRFAMGVPGPSSALAVARRFGVPQLLVERAQRFLSRDALKFEEMVQKLVAERHDLETARDAVRKEAEDLAKQRAAVDAEIARLRDKERTTLTEQGQTLLEAVRRARQEVFLATSRLKGKPSPDDVRTAARSIDAVAAKVALGGELSFDADVEAPARPAVDASAIKIGARVYVPKLRAEAEVVEVLSNGQLRVAAGPLKLLTRAEDVRAPAPKAAQPGSKSPSKQGKSSKSITLDAAADPDVPIQTSENTVDLRGLRQHEVVAMAEQFLDRMLGSGRRVAFLIHGHGTGALRDTIRDAMRKNPYVARSRPGEQREGGDGVTVVWLR